MEVVSPLDLDRQIANLEERKRIGTRIKKYGSKNYKSNMF